VVIMVLIALGAMMIRENERNRRIAEALTRTEEARQELAKFRSLADERQFYAGLIVPAGEHSLQYDTPRGEKAGAEALQLAAEYKDWDTLPESDDADFKREYHDLLLLSVQTKLQNPLEEKALDEKRLDELLDRLDEAAALAGPSRSLYLVRERCYHASGKYELAAKQELLERKFPETSLSHFLEGEWLRMEANALKPIGGDGAESKPDAEKLKVAIDHYQKALNQDPDNFWCHFQMGRCYLGLGMGYEALEALDTCAALRPKQPWAYSVRGLILALKEQYPEAQSDLDKALELHERESHKAFAPALLNRGYLFMQQKKYKEALEDFSRALELPKGQELIAAAYYRGQVYEELGERSKALADFELVKDEIRAAYLRLFEISFRDGDIQQALNQLTQYINAARKPPLNERNWELHYLRGRLLRPMIESREGGKVMLEELETAEQLGGRSADLYYELALVHYHWNRPDKAIGCLIKAWDAAPREKLDAAALKDLQIKVLNLRGWTYAQKLDKPDYEKASGDFAQVLNLQLDPQNAEAYSGLGFVYARQGQTKDAQSLAGLALAYGAGTDLVLHNVACIYAELSLSDKPYAELHARMAIKYIRRELELNPKALADVRKEAEEGGSFYALRNQEGFNELFEGSEKFRKEAHQ
jgi:tetratricopeptide (TPR) repeat protein